MTKVKEELKLKNMMKKRKFKKNGQMTLGKASYPFFQHHSSLLSMEGMEIHHLSLYTFQVQHHHHHHLYLALLVTNLTNQRMIIERDKKREGDVVKENQVLGEELAGIKIKEQWEHKFGEEIKNLLVHLGLPDP